MLYFSIVLKKLAKFFRGLLFLPHPYINCRMYSEYDEYHSLLLLAEDAVVEFKAEKGEC